MMQTLLDKYLSYFIVKYIPRVLLTLLTVRQIEHEKFEFVLSFIFFAHNSKTIGCIHILYIIRLLYYENCDIAGLELHTSYDWHHSILYTIFVCTYMHNLKTTGHTWMFYVLNDCSTIRNIFVVRLAWEIELESYGPRHELQLCSEMIMCVYCKHNQENRGACNSSSSLQSTPLLPKMILLVLNVPNQSQPASNMVLYVHYMTTKLTQLTTIYIHIVY